MVTPGFRGEQQKGRGLPGSGHPGPGRADLLAPPRPENSAGGTRQCPSSAPTSVSEVGTVIPHGGHPAASPEKGWGRQRTIKGGWPFAKQRQGGLTQPPARAWGGQQVPENPGRQPGQRQALAPVPPGWVGVVGPGEGVWGGPGARTRARRRRPSPRPRAGGRGPRLRPRPPPGAGGGDVTATAGGAAPRAHHFLGASRGRADGPTDRLTVGGGRRTACGDRRRAARARAVRPPALGDPGPMAGPAPPAADELPGAARRLYSR